MRFAVIGHVEWVHFQRVDKAPTPGSISHASDSWEEPAGGGGVAAAELARLGGECALYTALGNDKAGVEAGRRLQALGVSLHAAVRQEPQRQAITLIDPTGERTIVVNGSAQSPRGDDPLPFEALSKTDGVYFCKGDVQTLRAARSARVLVATARVLPLLQEAGVKIDVLVRSAKDEGEEYRHGDLTPPPGAVVATEGGSGGRYWLEDGRKGRYEAAPIPGEIADTYGAGDSFAAALVFGLASGLTWEETLSFAAGRGANALCRKGAHGASKRENTSYVATN